MTRFTICMLPIAVALVITGCETPGWRLVDPQQADGTVHASILTSGLSESGPSVHYT
jgi:hypothetical protein